MNTQPKFDWTEARVATLKELHEQGLSAGKIAGVMGVTRNMIVGKLHRLPTYVKRKSIAHKGNSSWTPEMIQIAIKGWTDGTPLAVIGAAIGKTAPAVSQYAQDHRDLFPKKSSKGRPKAKGNPFSEPEYIAPQFLVPPEGYDKERLEMGKTLAERGDRECCYPLGNGGPFIYCCAETAPGKSYCWHHGKRMHQPKGSGVLA